MAGLLVIESSARQCGSVSRRLTEDFLARWRERRPGDPVCRRDLGMEPLPHLDASLLDAWTQPVENHGPGECAALQRANRLSDELLAADVLVLAAPMYNFAIPSTLKAWFDHVVRAGVTFRYSENGPQGLLHGKRAFVLTARGGLYAGGGQDHQEPYLRQVLAFMGIHDVTFIHAEGLNLGSGFLDKGLGDAERRLDQVI
ncbi:FMN-dependent NADH-azoreductase [Pseudomonas flavescens]|uniref:FMN dependent NADH:quinone oxidoreductase n=1 Tax=Phytopseudomonas flavescens TaxID=29435 RepID=A0A1G7XYN6_9GAMM|nr:FMN-dependent NADH-azoreductase [Pseudomonas flavescens]SDG89203.1 FMN-dependent NADH-azoreductase [Pseudomonas flavescens]